MPDDYDVLVIGGGVTGAGVARDCALRGLRTILLERNDFAAGTTGTCMGMLHGGIRYLGSDPQVTRLSCIESGYIQKLAPHLVFRIPWLMPASSDRTLRLYAAFLAQYDLLASYKNSKPHVVLSAQEAHELEPALRPGIAGAVTWDEPGVNPFRLALLNVLSARDHGATVCNHSEVTRILREDERVTGVVARDVFTGEEREVRARYVVNAAGPWTPRIARLAGIEFRLKPTKGTQLILDRRITSVAVTHGGVEIVPHETTSIIGLTDTFFFDDPDTVRATPDEVEQLLAGMAQTIPSVRQARVIRAMSGVRPLIDQPDDDERNLTRKHRVYDHAELDGVEGLITVAGGKMVTYRRMAEDVTDLVCRKLGVEQPCRTRHEPLPGGERTPPAEEVAAEFELPLYTAQRLVTRHGALVYEVLAQVKESPALKSHLCICEPVTEAEIRWAVRHEWARTLDDLRRRTRLGFGPCQGTGCTARAAAILAEELGEGPDYAHRQVREFLQERWKGRYPVLTGQQLRQEELTRAVYVGVGGYGRHL